MPLRSFKAANTFTDLQVLYERLQPWRDAKEPGADRTLCYGRKRITGLRHENNGLTYKARYHVTDVVTWDHSGDKPRVTVKAWASASTENFANCLTPWNMGFMFMHSDAHYVLIAPDRTTSVHNRRVYQFADDQMSFEPDANGVWMPIDAARADYILGNTAETRQATRDTNLRDFMRWFETTLKLSNGDILGQLGKSRTIAKEVREDVILSLLAEPNNWLMMVDGLRYNRHYLSTNQFFAFVQRQLKGAILRSKLLPKTTDKEYIPFNEWRRQCRYRAQFRWVRWPSSLNTTKGTEV